MSKSLDLSIEELRNVGGNGESGGDRQPERMREVEHRARSAEV